MIEHGYVAVWRGVPHEASPVIEDGRLVVRLYRPDPADGFAEVGESRFVRTVTVEAADGIGYRRTVGEWLGCRVLVVAEVDEHGLLVEHVDGPVPDAGAGRFEDLGFGVRRARVPRSEVTGLACETDVLR